MGRGAYEGKHYTKYLNNTCLFNDQLPDEAYITGLPLWIENWGSEKVINLLNVTQHSDLEGMVWATPEKDNKKQKREKSGFTKTQRVLQI